MKRLQPYCEVPGRRKMDRLREKFLVFENEKNNCWLDASLSLIVYNKTFKKIVNGSKSQINYIIAEHEKAMMILNDSENTEERISKTKTVLLKIQQNTLQYLQHVSDFKEGEPDSAFCALLNLICQDKSEIKEQLIANWSWNKQCCNCGNNSKYDPPVKPIITLSKVKNFQPECPTSFYTCTCKTEQEMKLEYKLLPPCLIFHFEKGAGEEGNCPLNFMMEERKYHLTAVVVLEKSGDPNLNHFVTYIREPSLNLWLDCNDLNTGIVSFSYKQPEFALKDVCIYVFEAFDDLGKITNQISADTTVSSDQSVQNLNVEFIDLANEVEEVKQSLGNAGKKNDASKLIVKKESLLTSEEKHAECAIKTESKGKNKAVSASNLPLKKAIKERQLNMNIDMKMIPVVDNENNKPDINSDMMPIGSRLSFQKAETKDSLDLYDRKSESYVIKEKNNESKEMKDEESLCNFSGHASDDSKNEEQNADLVNLSSKADSHDSSSMPVDEQNSKCADSDVHRSKSDEFLSTHGLEFIVAQRKKELVEKAELSSVKSEQKCVSDCKSEMNSETNSLKKKLDKIGTPAKNVANNTQTKLEDEQTAEKSEMTNLSSSKVVSNSDEMLSQRSSAESKNDACEFNETLMVDKELLSKTKQAALKLKKSENTASSLNKKSKTVETSDEASNNDLTEANESAVRKSSRISSISKKVKLSKTQEPKEVSASLQHEKGKETRSSKTHNDKSVDEKVRRLADRVVECTFASFIEQIYIRQQNPM